MSKYGKAIVTLVVTIALALSLSACGGLNPFDEESSAETTTGVSVQQLALQNDLQSQLTATDKVVVKEVAARASADSSLAAQQSAAVTLQSGIDSSQDAAIASLESRVAAVEAQNSTQASEIAANSAAIKDLQGRVKVLEGRQATVGTKTATKTPVDLKVEDIASALATELYRVGWQKGDLAIGTVDWHKNQYDPRSHDFAPAQLSSQAKLVEFLNGNSAASKAARETALKNTPEAEHARVLNGEGYIPLQFLKDVCLKDNTYFKDGEVKTQDVTCHKAGDIVWVFMSADHKVYWSALVRANCGNPSVSAAPLPKTAVVCDRSTGTGVLITVPETEAGNYLPKDSAACGNTPENVWVCNPDTGDNMEVPADQAGKYPPKDAGACHPTTPTTTPGTHPGTTPATRTTPGTTPGSTPPATTPTVPTTPTTETPVCPPGQHGKPPLCKDDPSKQTAVLGSDPPQGEVTGPAQQTPDTVATQADPAATATVQAPSATETPIVTTTSPAPTASMAPSSDDPGVDTGCAPGMVGC